MAGRIAVALVHGAGVQGSDFAEPMIRELTDRFASELDLDREGAADRLAFEAVHWAPVLQRAQTKLWRRVSARGDLDYEGLRRFMVNFAGDAIAYQPTPRSREVYDSVHAALARALRSLARAAGRDAPLCVIAHSLGTIVASNYFYDLSQRRRRGMLGRAVRDVKKDTPLENGQTLALFYTMASPIAVWSLRYKDFGKPISVPSPELAKYHPGLGGEWINYYDADDVIGYPLRPLNEDYRAAVNQDVPVSVGNLATGWNPVSHTGYWGDDDVTKPIAAALARASRQINP